jgi:glutamine amidotransferase
MTSTIAIIDYGMGNLRSVAKALEHVAPPGTRVVVTADPETVLKADRVVFPGQGAAGDCMNALHTTGLTEAIRDSSANKPFLGVCIGMQVLVEHSDESGGTPCMGVFPGNVRYFGDRIGGLDQGLRYKIPHMGWNTIHQKREHPLWRGVEQDSYFYFVHSYYVVPANPDLVAGVTDYGIRFTSVIAQDNIFAMQCHPEKSADGGLKLLENFTSWDGQ